MKKWKWNCFFEYSYEKFQNFSDGIIIQVISGPEFNGIILKDKEFKEILKNTGIPSCIQDLINYKSCRGAIMFGDKLSKLECEELLSQLSKCKNPFICAHGRPSLLPLVDLSILEKLNKN